ncbi:zinc transporter 3 [Pyrgilauda ruficollis]|uniref:zinc transporter 3 n=1 Tax=Pyrgilauda ruficollis TaxID=221976 RepID=UPI001B8665C0|nr:zinc transporter 3 [Pyrgilauda ruficollis]
MEPHEWTGTESARLVSPRGGRADGSLRLKRYRRHRHPSPAPITGTHRPGSHHRHPSPAPPPPPAQLHHRRLRPITGASTSIIGTPITLAPPPAAPHHPPGSPAIPRTVTSIISRICNPRSSRTRAAGTCSPIIPGTSIAPIALGSSGTRKPPERRAAPTPDTGTGTASTSVPARPRAFIHPSGHGTSAVPAPALTVRHLHRHPATGTLAPPPVPPLKRNQPHRAPASLPPRCPSRTYRRPNVSHAHRCHPSITRPHRYGSSVSPRPGGLPVPAPALLPHAPGPRPPPPLPQALSPHRWHVPQPGPGRNTSLPPTPPHGYLHQSRLRFRREPRATASCCCRRNRGCSSRWGVPPVPHRLPGCIPVGGSRTLGGSGQQPPSRCRRHPPTPSPGQGRLQARQQLSVACAVCCLFMVGEVIGGYLAHSLAIMTDAAHLLTDVGSMSVSLFSLWVSNRPPTKSMTFGWHRSETLGALASVLSIWAVTAALVYLAAARIISNDYEIEARAMLATSACAVGVNLVMAYILHQSPAGHGHGTGAYEQLESSVACQPSRSPLPGSTSVRAAFVHVVGDLLQSVSVLVAATIIYFKPQCKIADPISTLFFSVFVLGSTITILRDVFRVLMEGTPRGLEFDAVKEVLLGASGVRGVHELHLWALTLSHPAVSVHVAVDAGADAEMVLQEVTARLQSRFGFVSCTVQVEQHQEESAGCPHCQDPRT